MSLSCIEGRGGNPAEGKGGIQLRIEEYGLICPQHTDLGSRRGATTVGSRGYPAGSGFEAETVDYGTFDELSEEERRWMW